jgi:predicted permease
MQNIIRAIRTLAYHPRYTFLAIVTLAAGIGVNSAMFGLLDAVFFRPLPIVDQERLIAVTLVSPDNRFSSLSYEEFREIERNRSIFKDAMAVGRRGVTLNHNGEATLLLINYVSGRFFPSLGIPMHLGRGLTEEDDRPDAAEPRVVINHHLWKERLGAPPDIIGRTIQLNSTHFTVVGVTAAGFVGLDRVVRTDVWVTTEQAPLVVSGLRQELTDRRHRWFHVIARLHDDKLLEHATTELDLLAAQWRAADPAVARDYQNARLVARAQRDEDRDRTKQGAIFLGLVGLVLLIACANVANLTLARGEGRRREMSVRSALGATRRHLVRQILLETGIVVLAGTVVGLLIAVWLMRLIPALLPPGASAILLDLRVDGRLFGFATLVAVLTTAVIGYVPAWRGSRVDITSGLKALPATTPGARRLSFRDALVVGEVALSGVIVIAAGLLVRSFAQSLAMNPGFDTGKNVATFYVVPGLKGYDAEGTYRLLEDCRRAASAVAGVTRASYGIRLPGQGNEAGWSAPFVIPGHEPPPGKTAFDIRYTMVGPDYFAVMGTRILTGRGIVERDQPTSAPVAVISETMARRFWPGQTPIGRRIRMGLKRPIDREIVGVVEDIRIGGLYEPPEMYVYVPFAQSAQQFGLLLVEAQNDSASIVGAIKHRVAEIDPALPVLGVGSFAQHMDLLLYEDRRNAWVALAVSLLALTLGAVGIHGVVSLVTARRTKEIGIRVALGSSRGQLVRLLLGKGTRLVMTGAVLGIAGGVVAGRLLSSQLHGLDPADTWSLALGTAVSVLVALAASFTPVWRATRVDPAVLLRDE